MFQPHLKYTLKNDVLQKLPSSQINLYCLSAEIFKHQRLP
jgi:hypothetical protein